MKKTAIAVLLALIATGQSAQADLPLSLEGISPEQSRFKFGASLSYYNSSERDYGNAAPLYFHTPHNTLIEIPGRVQQERLNRDMLYVGANLAYGISDNTELYASIGGLWREERRSRDDGNTSHDNHAEFSDITLGISQVLLKDGNNPMLIGVLETSAYEKVRGKHAHGQSWYAGINAYKAVDPVVFTFSAGYRMNFHDKAHYRPGNYFLLRPGISFAANDRTTFNAQLKFTGRDAASAQGRKQGHFASDTHAMLGAGYALSKQTSIRADWQWHLSGDDGAVATLAFTHKF